jgi:hypothetical protein
MSAYTSIVGSVGLSLLVPVHLYMEVLNSVVMSD